jgi:hypothetical protein
MHWTGIKSEPSRWDTSDYGRGHTILTSREIMWCFAGSLGCERRFNIEFYGADSHFCHSAYVTWSRVEIWSAPVPAHLKFLLSYTFRETWRTCRALFRRYQLFPEMGEMLTEKGRQPTFLYDTKQPDYRDLHMRANVWEGIGEELNIKRKFHVSSRDVRIVCPRLNCLRHDTCPNKLTQPGMCTGYCYQVSGN